MPTARLLIDVWAIEQVWTGLGGLQGPWQSNKFEHVCADMRPPCPRTDRQNDI